MLLGAEFLAPCNEHRLRFHHGFHFGEIVAHQCATRRHDVENGIGKTDTRGDFHRTCNHVYVSFNAVFLEKLIENHRVGGSNLAVVEPCKSGVFDILGNCKRQAAAAKAERTHNLHIALFFHHLVKSHDADVGSARRHRIGDVVVAEEKEFYREIA